jgi:hypothetical protein
MFIYTPEDNGIQILSKINGLSDVTLSAVNHRPETNLIILGYENGNVDIIEDKEVFNIIDIKNADISYQKKILDIEFFNQFVYFIMEFGVIVYNQQQNAIKETWQNLGADGDFLQITKGSVLRDTIFLATERGVIAGDLDPGNNLLDYRNWKHFQTDEGLPPEPTREMEILSQNLYAVQNDNMIYQYEDGRWRRVFSLIDGNILSVKSNNAALTFTLSDRVYYIKNEQPIQEITDDHFLSLKNAIIVDEDLYAADFINGLIRIHATSSEVIRPSGPFANDIYKIFNFGDEIVVLPQGFDNQYQPLGSTHGFYHFNDGSWENYNNTGGFGTISIPDIKDLIDIDHHPFDDKIFFASHGYGLMEWDQEISFTVYDENIQGVTLINSNPPERFTLVPALEVDHSGKVWMSNYNSSLPLHEFEPPDAWTGYPVATLGTSNVIDLIITGENNLWLVVHPAFGGGIIVYNEESGQVQRLTTQVGSGGLPDNNITAIIKDLDGQIWVGTTDGVAYFPFPFLVFDDPDFEAIRPIYENNFLFRNETITSLDVDGGNRKWIGTDKGAWLFSPDGTELIRNFNMKNSPILSDKINDVEVNQVSGEVFFGTDKGLISFRGDAVASEDKHSNVKIFPNPVTPNFNGIVGIQGLPQNSVVKITDISGKLVYETRSEGGMATWNVIDNGGGRPDTGIYLVFSSTEDGSDTYVGKLAIVK